MKDEAKNLVRALASIPEGASVLAIDAESRDGSVAIASAFGARTIVRPWAGFVETRRFAVDCVTTPWTFMLDADEALDDDLVRALGVVEPPAGIDAYGVRRATYFCGKAMRYGSWGNDTPLRFFRTSQARLEARPVAGGAAAVHERWSVPGRTQTLAGRLLHYSYPTVAAYRAKLARYTSLEARGLHPSRLNLVRSAIFALLRVPWALVIRNGWRDGWRGAFVAIGSAAYPVIVAWKALRA